MLVVLVSFLFGIFWGLYIKNSLIFLVFLIILGIILYKNNKKSLFLIFALMMTIGFLYVSSKEIKNNVPLEFKVKNNFIIVSLRQTGEYTDFYIAKDKLGRNIRLYVSKELGNLEYGDYVFIEGDFVKAETAGNEYEFDYRQYLKQKDVVGLVFTDKVEKIGKKQDLKTKLIKNILEIRKKSEESLDKFYEEKICNFLKAMLLGDTSTLEEEISLNFEKSNLSHIIAISRNAHKLHNNSFEEIIK